MRKKNIKKWHTLLSITLSVLLIVTSFFPGLQPIVHAEEVTEKQEQEKNQAKHEFEHESISSLVAEKEHLVEVSIANAESVTLHIKTPTSEENEIIQMESSEADLYTATIPNELIQPPNIEYWFEATIDNETITSLPYIVEVESEEKETVSESTDTIDESMEEEQTNEKPQKEGEPKEEKLEEETNTQESEIQEETFVIEHTPVIEATNQQPLFIEATVPHAEEVTVQFKSGEKMEIQELPFTANEEDQFQVEIPKDILWSPHFSYRIIAESNDGEEMVYPEEGWIDVQVNDEETVDTQTLPKLLITEITPDTDNVGGLDAYEFIEIYNNSNQVINIKDYQLLYQYPDGRSVPWDLTEDKEIKPEESFIVWIHNGENYHLSVDDFNDQYGLNISDNHVTIIESGGMANGSERSLVVADDYQNEIVRATYNDNQDDVSANKGITYKHPIEGLEMRKVGISEDVTPTSILPGQVPSEVVQIDTEQEAPVIGKATIQPSGDKVTIEIEVTSEQDLANVYLYYRQSEAMNFESIPMEHKEDAIYTLDIPLQSIWSNKVDYYFTASTTAGITTETDIFEFDVPSVPYDSQSIPRLLITEVTPDTDNQNGWDAYEFIEIYNNSNQPINISDYKLIYRYPTSTPDQTWDLMEDKEIGPGESFIVWIHNDGNKDLTIDDFNHHYGLDMPESHVTIIENDGMANGSERTLLLMDDFDNMITEASYNKDGKEVVANQGIMYKFPTQGQIMENVGIAKDISPLIVYPEQIPTEPVNVESDAEVPTIGQPSTQITDEEIRFEVEVQSEETLVGVNLYYSQSNSFGFKAVPMENIEDNIYSIRIPREEIWNNEITYYIVAQNQAGQTTTDEEVLEIPEGEVDYQSLPSLLITEVVPDTSNENGADAYEFIEVYNNTTEAIDFSDYIIRYRYPNTGAEGDLLWGPTEEEIIIPSGEAIVLWVINGGNPHLTGEDFNQQFGTNLTEGENLLKIYNNGMSNSAERTLIVATKTGDEISEASYNDVLGVDDTQPNKGILYRYSLDGNSMKKISAGEMDATPGTVFNEQVPKEKVQLPTDTTAPSITDKTTTESITSEHPLNLTATVTDNEQVKSVSVYYRTIEGSDFIKVNLERQQDNIFQHTVYEPELIGQKTVEYYFVASDGKNKTTSETRTIHIEHPNQQEGLRLNVTDNELLSGEMVIKATEDGYTEDINLFIDDNQVTDTFQAMENEAYFAFDVSETNIYFKNGVVMGDEILEIFDDTYNNFVTITVPIPAHKLQVGENTISIRAGNKVSPFDEESTENRDDFTIKNVRLVLSDGTIIYDPNYSDPSVNYSVGDSAGKEPVYDFSFTLQQEQFTSLAYLFDTTTVSDGEHDIRTTLGEEEVSANVIVDNTAPSIDPSIEDGEELKGTFTIDADVTDANGVNEIQAQLDGSYISLPYETSSAILAAGEHEVIFTAVDNAGNTATSEVTFTVVEEHPLLPDWLEKTPESTSAELSVRVNDPTGDNMDVAFYEAYQYTAEDTENIDILEYASETEPPQTYLPEGENSLTDEDREKLMKVDGEKVSTESTNKFPYHRFDITVDEHVGPDDEIEIVWNGSSLDGRKVTMYAWNFVHSEWDTLTSTIAGDEDFQLIGAVTAEEYLHDGKVSVIVQDQVAAEGEDFTFVWMSDTQYYSESYPYIYEDIVDWILEKQDELNIEYVFHTGDLVDVYDDFDQWTVADENMKKLDDANIPYGVLAGNHDVDNKSHNYENYYQYFGADRFEDRPYYGGSYLNNRGHYDLISVNGNDFIMIYMGWGVDQEGIDWMNEVLAAHPNRTAILNVHEYLLATGTRSPIGDELFEKVVVPNENVIAVLSGHYHNAQTLIDEIDDNDDGETDRTVYQMLADYQGGPEGGQGYIRLLHFNMGSNTVSVETYSPYLDDYNFYDVEDYPGKDEFTIKWNLEPQLKKVATDYIEVNVYTNHEIGLVENVPSNEIASVTWNGLDPNREYFWYTVATDQFGGSTRSDIWSFMTKDGEVIIPDDDESDESEDKDEKPVDKDDTKPNETGDKDSNNKSDDEMKQEENNETNDSSNGEDEEDKVITPIQKEKENNETPEKSPGNNLPSTATNIFNYLLLGLLLTVAGISLYFRKKIFMK